jgi:uncharacterized membrane protein
MSNQLTFRVSSGRTSDRLIAIDAARGLMMLFSCLAHFAWWLHAVYPSASADLASIGMVATPSFLLISGAMVGMLAAGNVRLQELKTKLFNRGLFLLTIGHALISLAEAHQDGGLLLTIKNASVVDEIGLATVLASLSLPFLAHEHVARRVASIAIVIFCVCWIVVMFWHPTSNAGLIAKQVLLGGDSSAPRVHVYTSPMLQYLSIYAMGLPLGHVLKRRIARTDTTVSLASLALIVGGSLAIGAFALHMVIDAFAAHGPTLSLKEALTLTARVTHKIPPTPLYLAFFAGTGLALTGLLMTLNARHIATRWLSWLATIGRASLFVFVLQYFLYWTLPDLLGINVNRWCALVFILNVLLIYHAAAIWAQFGGNRLLTLGIPLSPREKRAQVS